MKELTCSKCGAVKEVSCFYKRSKLSRGYSYWCIDCDKQSTLDTSRTVDGVVTSIYSTQRTSSKARGHELPKYSKEEFGSWLKSQDKFKTLYDAWVASGYKKNLKPSVDRIDVTKGYSFDNIQLLTWKENNQKRHEVDAAIKPHRGNTSGRTGVHWDKKSNNWVASIRYNGKRIVLGREKSRERAVELRSEAERGKLSGIAPTPFEKEPSSSGHEGVYWDKGADRWRVYVYLKNKPVYLGVFLDKEEAIRVRDLAEDRKSKGLPIK